MMNGKEQKALFEKALDLYKENIDNKEFFEFAELFFGSDEKLTNIVNNFYCLAEDGMPKEIVDCLMGNVFIGFLMGKIYSEENYKNREISNGGGI